MAWLDRWLIGTRPFLLLGGLCLLLYLPGIASIPALDRDEARFAQATRQMLETGDFLRIRFQEEARNKKPAGIYWLQSAAVAAFSTPASTAMWPYRLPSLLGATLAVWLTFAFGRRLFPAVADDDPVPRRIALIAAGLLASSLGVVAEAHIAKTDAAMLATVVAGQGALGLAYLHSRAGRAVPVWIAAAFWAAETAAVLLKGPPAPALAIVTAATLAIADRDLRWLRSLRPAAGLAAMAVALMPWLIAIVNATEGHFLSQSLGQDLFAKLLGAQESHGAPPFYYLLLAVLTFWPASLFAVPALVRARRYVGRPAERFLLAWIVPAWVLIELVPTKLPHYALPLYPALALLAAVPLVEAAATRLAGWERWAALAAQILWALVALTLAAAMIGLPLRFGEHMPVAGAVGALVLAALAAALLRRPAMPASLATVAALSAVFVVAMTQTVLPGLDRLWLSRSAAALVAMQPTAAAAPLVAVGYSEPSLVFLLGTRIRLTSASGAASALVGGGRALVSGREEAMFRQALTPRGLAARAVGSVRGLDYSNGQRMVLTLYDVTPG